MAFHQTIFDLAFFVAPAIAVALNDEEKADLARMETMLQRRKTELALCSKTRSLNARVKGIKADILDLETAIADLRTSARYRRNV